MKIERPRVRGVDDHELGELVAESTRDPLQQRALERHGAGSIDATLYALVGAAAERAGSLRCRQECGSARFVIGYRPQAAELMEWDLSGLKLVLGERALIHRCREHKKRNVTDALPERMSRVSAERDEPNLCDERSEARTAPA